MEYKKELQALGASDFQQAALGADEKRGRAALAEAQRRGADNPVPYAVKLYESSEWNPAGEARRVVTNAHVERRCDKCGGDRFVVVTDDWRVPYGETYAPCAGCNAEANTAFYRVDGTRVVAKAR
jgi:hypothetical protein